MEPMIGEVRMFGGNFAPRGWAFCEGQLLAISQNQALFSILGTTYGGDGRTTFGLPDLRGRVAISPGTGPGLPTYKLGDRSGQTTVTLNTTQMPSHNHIANTQVVGAPAVGVNGDGPDSNTPAGAHLGGTGTELVYNGEDPTGLLEGVSAGTLGVQTTVLNNGGNQAHNNMQPYLAVYYIIALTGIFPSRS